MTDLTSEQIADFRADIGDSNAAFSPDELNRLYARAGGDYNTAIFYAWRQLLASAQKFNDYSAGLSSEKKSQLFDHAKAMAGYWEAQATRGKQVGIVGMRRVPSPVKDIPNGEFHPDEKAQRHDDNRLGWLRRRWW